MFIFRSFPSSVTTVPVYTMSPFGGTFVYSLRRCWAEVMAPRTDCLFTRDLMFEAVPYSVWSIVWVWLI